MKAVPKVNTDGLYLEDTLVDDAYYGVVPFYAQIETQSYADPDEAKQPEGTPEPEIAGYIVGIAVTPGFYRPHFDLVAWKAYQEAENAANIAFQAEYVRWSTLPEEERREPQTYVSSKMQMLWGEGLAPEEIEEITRPQPQEPLEVDLLKERLAAAETRNEQLAEEVTLNQLALMELHMMILELKEGGITE